MKSIFKNFLDSFLLYNNKVFHCIGCHKIIKTGKIFPDFYKKERNYIREDGVGVTNVTYYCKECVDGK